MMDRFKFMARAEHIKKGMDAKEKLKKCFPNLDKEKIIMKKYDPDGKCVKCGCEDIEDWHRNPDSDYTMSIVRCFNTEAERSPERIVRACKLCGYGWDEAPLDAKTSFDKYVDVMVECAADATGLTKEELLKSFSTKDETPPPRVNDLVKRREGRGCDSKSPCRIISAIEPIVVRSTAFSCHCMHASERFHLIERAPETIQLCNSILDVRGAGHCNVILAADNIIGVPKGKYAITLTKKEDTQS